MVAQDKEFWRWKEEQWVDSDKSWKDSEAITLGIDVGSVSSEAVVCLDGEVFAYNTIRTGSSSPESAEKVTLVPDTKLLLSSRTRAVRVTVSKPSEFICGLLTRRRISLAAVPVSCTVTEVLCDRVGAAAEVVAPSCA